MDKEDTIAKIRKAGLTGRGGAGFPTADKWQAVANQKSDRKYIICNASEGEPGVFKDRYLLEKHMKEVAEGVKIALETIDHSLAYIYLNKEYYKKFGSKLEKLFKGFPVVVFEKRWGYLGGEETAACEVIEGRRPVVRKKPPFPTEKGLWGFPTIINNVETFYFISKIMKGEYENTRLYCVSGGVKKEGVWEFPLDYTARKVLEETGNFPESDFFVQIGGGACGEILLPAELDKQMCGTSSIIVFDREKTDPYELMEEWADFFMEENCDKCVPCREGMYRIAQMVKSRQLDREMLEDVFVSIEKSSFCAMGRSIPAPFRSLINKVL